MSKEIPTITDRAQFLSVELRGHHLLCILTYVGMGYPQPEDFVPNYDTIMARLNQGAKIKIVSGPDDICTTLVRAGEVVCAHARVCTGDKVKNSDALALQEVASVLNLPSLKPGDIITLAASDIQKSRTAFAANTNRGACQRCLWKNACTEIAESGFQGVRLLPSAVPGCPPSPLLL